MSPPTDHMILLTFPGSLFVLGKWHRSKAQGLKRPWTRSPSISRRKNPTRNFSSNDYLGLAAHPKWHRRALATYHRLPGQERQTLWQMETMRGNAFLIRMPQRWARGGDKLCHACLIDAAPRLRVSHLEQEKAVLGS